MRSFALLVLSLFALLPCCGGEAGPNQKGGTTQKRVVGFAQTGAESDWRAAETESIRSEARTRGITLKFVSGQSQQAKQIQAIRSFVRQKVDAIFLAPIVETGWENALGMAKEAGIPVILLDRGISEGNDALYHTLIASDFVEEGRMAARWLAEQLQRRHGAKAGIVELEGTPGSSPANDRHEGFHEVMQEHPGLEVILAQTGNFNRDQGKRVMEAFLKSRGNEIHAVYAHNDDMALGAIQALIAAGKKPGKDVLIVSIDGTKAAFEAMARGELNATVECLPLLGPYAFDALESILAGEETAAKLPKWIKVQDQVHTQDKAAELLPTRKY